MKELLLASIREHPKLPEEERGNLLGECDLIQSFLMYNDISRMSQFHRSASEKMTRPAISIRSDWRLDVWLPICTYDVSQEKRRS